MRGMFLWVSTISTPGAFSAALVSIDTVRPFATVL
jgi:hypothetical protein